MSIFHRKNHEILSSFLRTGQDYVISKKEGMGLQMEELEIF